MEDSATIGQWNKKERVSHEMDDSLKGYVSSARGSSVGFLTPTPDGTKNLNLAAPKRVSGQDKSSSRNSKGNSAEKLPLITSKRKKMSGTSSGSAAATDGKATDGKATDGKATAVPATKPQGKSESRKSRKAGGSRSSSPTSRPSGSSKSPPKRRASRSASTTRSRGSSRGSSAPSVQRRVSSKGKARPRSGGRKGSAKGKKPPKGKEGRKKSLSSRRSTKGTGDAAALHALSATEEVARTVIMNEEETARDDFLPDYHLLVMNVVRSQVREVNRRQQQLNDAFKALQAHGIHLASGQDPDTALETMREKMKADAQKQMEELQIEIGTLRGLLDAKKMEVEEKVAEAQNLRDRITRRLMRFEVENESLRAEVQAALQTNQLDVDRMKRELSHRLDVATASLRSPKYDTALRSMQELARSVQEEIQEHHDVLSKLIVSISAQDTFLRDMGDSMHSNFPTRYRDELRKLDKDQLLNLLDVLSFHDAVVETVGKALYVLQKSEHTTNVF